MLDNTLCQYLCLHMYIRAQESPPLDSRREASEVRCFVGWHRLWCIKNYGKKLAT
jgi:hypothetical protein